MSSFLFAELAATCNAIGYYDGIKYHKDTHCLETIKDLIRYLRRDDENHEIRRYLGEANIVKTDIIPLFKDYADDKYLFEVILRLLVNLTNPVLILFREELPEEKVTRNYYLQMIGHLQAYKEAFVDEKVWTVLGKQLGDILQIEWQERDEDSNLTILRILTLARNILQVPSDPVSERRPDNDASLHDQILWSLHVSGLVEIFLYLACSENEEQYYMYILEITSLMLREQNSAQLAVAAAQRSVTEQMKDESELVAIRKRELMSRQEKIRKYARHSRFLGTYSVKNVPSISDRDLIFHRPLTEADSLGIDQNKKKLKRPKNRLPLKDETGERRSAFSIRLFLKEFCVEFLNGAYNNLMYRVKQKISGGETQPNDESYYLWAMKFFMEFNRCYKFRVELISETIVIQTFHFVQTQIENNFEMMKVDKKKIPIWSRRLHVSIRAYQELLMTLQAMTASPDQKIRDSANVIKSNIFYVVEYRELGLVLLQSFEPVKMSMNCLQDLIQTIHVFMKLLEDHCRSNRTVLVQKKKVKSKKGKKKKSTPAQQTEETADKEENLEEQWEEIGPQLSAVLQGEFEIPDDIVPFDATSEVGIDDQRVDAMKRIHEFLRDQKPENAIGLLRAAREVWPENDYFGNSMMAPEEEFIALRDIYFADIQRSGAFLANAADEVLSGSPPGANKNVEPPRQEDEERDSEDEEEDEEGPAHSVSVAEQNFQFKDFISRFATIRVIQPCCLLLRNFKTNSAKVNRCVIRLMHRIAVECNYPALFFQASLFRTFQHILEEYKYYKSRACNTTSEEEDRNKVLKELAKFAIFIIRKFTEVAKENHKAFMELLFWKTTRDAYDIEEGYGSYLEKKTLSKKVWTEEQEDELRRLCEEFRAKGVPEEDLPNEVHQNIIDKEKSLKAVTKKLKELGLYTAPPRRKLSRAPKFWDEEEIAQLTSLYQELKDANDPVGMIIDRLNVKRSKKRVIEKLLDLGLASDRSELHKKRKPGARKNKSTKSNGGNIENGDDSDQHSRSSSGSEEESSSEDSDVDGDDGNGDVPKVMKKQPKKQIKSSGRSKPKKSNFSSAEVNKAIWEAIKQGFASALEWLIESLEEAAEEEGDESVPLLPISEDAVLAMDSKFFQSVLKVIGIVEPDGEQEMYWRIPAHWTPCDMRTRAQVIDFMLKNKEDETNEANESSTARKEMDDLFSSLISEPTNVETSTEQKAGQKRKNRNRYSSSSSDDNFENFLQAKRNEFSSDVQMDKTQTSKMRPAVSMAENEDGSPPATVNIVDEMSPAKKNSRENSPVQHQKKKKKLIRIAYDSSDDEIANVNVLSDKEEDQPINHESSDSESGNKEIGDSSIQNSLPKKKLSKRLISDDEDE